MNLRKFLRDFKKGRNDYSTVEAAESLDIELSQFRYLVRNNVIEPLEGGGRGRSFYFSKESLDELNEKLENYR